MISATIALVVVLPFVAEITTQPRSSLALRSLIAAGASASRIFPGALVPPLPPILKISPANRATALATANRKPLTPAAAP